MSLIVRQALIAAPVTVSACSRRRLETPLIRNIGGAHGAKNDGSTSAVSISCYLQTVMVFIAPSASVWLV